MLALPLPTRPSYFQTLSAASCFQTFVPPRENSKVIPIKITEFYSELQTLPFNTP